MDRARWGVGIAMKIKRDSYLRAKLFEPSSFQHAGRANLNLISILLEKHAPTGELVVDVMGGTGSILIALDHQHPVVSGELEAHWARVSEANRQSIRRARLFCASTPALCCQWDATRLPLASASVPSIITSPPYWDMLSNWHIKSGSLQGQYHEMYGVAYGLHAANIGNIHIYEDYLRTMATVYHECYRVLRPGGMLALIVKDRVHKKRVTPIVRDTVALATALGFKLVDQIEREVIPSLHRHINKRHHPDAPTVDSEHALIFEKQNRPMVKRYFALVQAPKPNSAPSVQLFQKSLSYAFSTAKIVLVLCNDGLNLYSACRQFQEPTCGSFLTRKQFSFGAVNDLVMKFNFATGDEVELHCAMGYGQYLSQRLHTYGGLVTMPTEGLNLGQKLKFYTLKG